MFSRTTGGAGVGSQDSLRCNSTPHPTPLSALTLSFPNPTPGLLPAPNLALIPNMHLRPTLPPQSRCRSENKVEGAHGTSAGYFRHVPSNTCVSLLIWNMRFGELFNSHVHTALKYSILTRREAVPREAVTLKFSLVPTSQFKKQLQVQALTRT